MTEQPQDEKMNWKVVQSDYLHKEPWLTIRKDVCKLPNGNIVPSFYVNEYPDWVNAVALTTDGKVVMVKQYRHGIEQVNIEIPGGVLEEGETPQQGVEREVLEETGYRFDKVEFLGKVSANPSTTNNWTHLFLATGGVKVAEQNLDDSEDVEVVLMTIDELKSLIRNWGVAQSLHLNCLFYALERLGELRY